MKTTRTKFQRMFLKCGSLVRLVAFCFFTFSLTVNSVLAQTPFTPDNIVVLQVGDGSSLLNGRSRPVSLVEYTPAGGFVVSHPVSHSGGNRLTMSSNATSEGQITRSADLLKIVIAGYDADTGLQSVGSTSASSVVPRVIGTMNGSGVYARPTSSNVFFSGNGFRSAASSCDDYWGAGAGTSSGINYFGLGAPGNVSSFIEDNLIVNIFNGQLYFSTQNTFTGIYKVGTGLPTGTGNPSTVEIDLPFGSMPFAFAFNAAGDLCYIADGNTDGTGGVQKWRKILGFWMYDYTLSVGANTGARGLTVDFSGDPILYATTTGTPSKLVSIVDQGSGSPFTVLATAAANTAFRGVSFSPYAAVATAPTSNSPICVGTTLQLHANATGSPNLTYQWSGAGSFSSTTVSDPTVTGASTGLYTVTVSDACGSSTASVSVTVNSPSESHDTLVACESYTWNTVNYAMSGDYSAGPFVNAVNCDSMAYIHLTVLHADDNNVCTTDACDPVTGVTHTPINYDDNNVCTTDACDPITGPSHTLINYDDNDVCTTDACDPITGPSHTMINYDDNNVCTIDACDPITGPSHTMINYDDNDVCTTDACDPITGPSHTIINYDDNNVCTTDACDPITGPSHTTINYDDNNVCTTDACDPITGPSHTTINYDDNNVCTTDACDPITGPSHTLINYDDNDVCTTDACDPITGPSHTPINYDDNNVCTTEYCDPIAGAIYTPINYDDNNVCTTDACDPITGPSHTLINYDDENVCTTDACDPITGPSHTLINYDDNNVCTTDACDPITGPSHTLINYDDNNVCTTDACDPVEGPSRTPNYDDNNVCTTDACDPITGPTHTPINYDDNNVCTTDACDPITGPSHTPVNTDDGNPCTADGCDPVHGVYHTPLPTTLTVGPISGPLSQCVGSFSGTSSYSVPAIMGATFAWSVPAGVNIVSGQGTNSIVVDWGFSLAAKGVQGPICVYAFTVCATGNTCDMLDISMIVPVTPSSISGPSKICPGDTVVFSVGIVSRTSAYNWTLPAGLTLISGYNTNVITAVADGSYSGGTVSVKASNACGSSPARIKNVVLNPPTVPAAISGYTGGVCGMANVIYSIAAVPNSTSYFWTVPGSATLNSGQGTASISVSFPGNFTSGNVTVYSINACGVSAVRSITVVGAPSTPGPVTGATNVCTGSVQHYSIMTVMNTASYTWTAPGTIIAGQGTKEIDVQYGPSPAGGQVITVKATNACGTSAARLLNAITISFCPRMGNSTEAEGINVYPNPASGKVTLEIASLNETNAIVSMIDLSGRTVMSVDYSLLPGVNTSDINLDGFNQGIYIIRVIKDGIESNTKVVVE